MSVQYAIPVKFQEGRMLILDQTRLPQDEIYIEMTSKEDVWDAIYHLKVRGAPAIGVAAAYGLYISAAQLDDASMEGDSDDAAAARRYLQQVKNIAEYLSGARPTAVNLSWALNRMVTKLEAFLNDKENGPQEGKNTGNWRREAENLLLEEAESIRKEDEASCYAMGEYGLSLLRPGMGILTHCNAGSLATAKYGTCLAPIYLGHERNYGFRVFSDETRPLLQGARLTCWELSKAGIDVTLICDNMASIVMKKGWIDAVVVGCDRMAANGDGANKIGTSGVAILAKEYGIPFYMFVPTSTIDLGTPAGDDIIIEERKGEEIYKMWYEKDMAPEGIRTYNPAFDVTDHRYITAVVTEKGIVRPPYTENIKKLFE